MYTKFIGYRYQISNYGNDGIFGKNQKEYGLELYKVGTRKEICTRMGPIMDEKY